MYRKRLIGLLSALMLGISAGPAAALESLQAQDVSVTSVQAQNVGIAAEIVEAAAQTARDGDPEFDEGIDGVGHLLIDLDEEHGTLTLGLGIAALGVDESVTLPPADGGGADGEDTAVTDPSPQQQAESEHKANLQQTKVAAVDAAPSRPAFVAGHGHGNASGTVSSGTGVTSSIRPATSPTQDGISATAPIADANANPWLQIMGVVMLAGTSTAWTIAKREGLA